MPFFKDIWQRARRPEEVNPFIQQYAASLLAGGGSKGPIARAGNKLVGGLLMGGQNWASEQEKTKILEDRAEVMGMLAPKVDVTRTSPDELLPPGTDPFTPQSVPQTQAAGGVLSSSVDPFAPMSSEELTPEAVAAKVKTRMPDVWGAMEKASKSKDPMLNQMAEQFMMQQLANAGMKLDPKDRFAVTPQGVVFDRAVLARTGSFEQAVKFNPIKDQKYQDVLKLDDGSVIGVKMDGSEPDLLYKFDPKKDIDTEIVWTDDPSDPTGYKQIGTLINSETGATIKRLGSRLQPGAGQGGYQYTTGAKTKIQQEAYTNEYTLENLQGMMDEFQADPELQEYFTLPGKVEFTKSKILDALGQLDKDSPERAKYQKLAQFVAKVERNSARMIKAMTGAQMSEAEAQRLLKGIANSSDTAAAFAGKLQAAIDEFRALGRQYDEWVKQFGTEYANMRVVDEGEDILVRAETAGSNVR